MTEPQSNEPPPAAGEVDLRRVLMDRARAHAERDRIKPPRRPLQSVVALALAVATMLVIFFAFDAFLGSVQRALHVMDEQDKAQERAKAREPMPAYAVPAEPPPASAPTSAPQR